MTCAHVVLPPLRSDALGAGSNRHAVMSSCWGADMAKLALALIALAAGCTSRSDEATSGSSGNLSASEQTATARATRDHLRVAFPTLFAKATERPRTAAAPVVGGWSTRSDSSVVAGGGGGRLQTSSFVPSLAAVPFAVEGDGVAARSPRFSTSGSAIRSGSSSSPTKSGTSRRDAWAAS